MPTEEANKVIARRFYEELWNQGNVVVADEVLAANHVDHNPPIPEAGTGREAAVKLMQTFKRAFPDFHITIDELIASDDRVIERFTFRGTHQGEMLGVAPTGKRVEATAISICRIDEDGRVAERWGVTDGVAMLTQLGMLPEPGSAGWHRLVRLANANTRVRTSRTSRRALPAAAAVGGLVAAGALLLRKRS